MRIKLLLPAFLLLIAITRINNSFNPLIWPDEVLFSSPAANLAEQGTFGTPVLEGLIPGMEKATLWNSPLFMVLLSGVYFFTGEDLEWARTLSLIISFLALYYFLRNLEFIVPDRILLFILPLILAHDITFQRSANTARMDMLTLLFFLMTHHQLLAAFMEKKPETENKRYFLAGIFTGFAGLSHPFGIFLLPVIGVYALPDLKKLAVSAAGVILSFSLWLFYILPNLDLFIIQFSLQMKRKPNLFSLWGGDTGGIFKVFFSQYGGSVFFMVLGAAVFFTSGAIFIFHLYSIRRKITADPFFRIFLSFAFICGFALISSEGWYVLYCGPFFLLTVAALSGRARIDMKNIHGIQPGFFRNRLPLILFSLFIILSDVFFTWKHHFKNNTPAVVSSFLKSSVPLAEKCSSIYIRVRPDPYFHLRKRYPDLKILEFIPGKLLVDNDRNELFSQLNAIDCFFLDSNESWEPNITEYISTHKNHFTMIQIHYADPAGMNFFYIRKKPAEVN